MTPSMFLFFSLSILLCAVLALVVIYPWLRKKTANDNQLMAVNVAVFGERIKELETDKAAGLIDQTTFEIQQTELKRQLLNAQMQTQSYAPASKKSRIIVLIWIPILAVLAYLISDNRTAVFTLWQAQDTLGQVADDLLTGKIDTPPKWATKDSSALISTIQTNVHHHADDPKRWLRLSELFLALDAKPQALEALARAYRLNPTDTDVAITYAQTSFFVNNGTIDSAARDVLLTVLKHTPDHEGAQMLMAMGETRAGNFGVAKVWIAKLRSNIASKSGDRSGALASLDELTKNIEAQELKVAQGVRMTIKISNELLPQIKETDVLFVAISDSKGGAPYAVKRLAVSGIQDAQITVNLSDLDAMMPERTLSKAYDEKVALTATARISHNGTVTSQSGDLSAVPVVLAANQNQVDLTISQITP